MGVEPLGINMEKRSNKRKFMPVKICLGINLIEGHFYLSLFIAKCHLNMSFSFDLRINFAQLKKTFIESSVRKI